MKQGLKIFLFVLPQLFALFVKSNTAFSATDFTHKQSSITQLSDQHFSNVVIADSFKDYEIELEDDEFTDYFISFPSKEFIVKKKNEIPYSCCFSHTYNTKLYILYSSLKLNF
jgi:hypothetical protein|tara:strand:+ start:203 stop:541 length:339 start_codon:yes stop_codon:yes gene_type:complete